MVLSRKKVGTQWTQWEQSTLSRISKNSVAEIKETCLVCKPVGLPPWHGQ